MISNAIRVGNLADEQTAVALYALIGVLLCASWVVFFWYLHRHRELTKEHVGENFFARETTRAWAGVVLYAIGGAFGISRRRPSRWPSSSPCQSSTA